MHSADWLFLSKEGESLTKQRTGVWLTVGHFPMDLRATKQLYSPAYLAHVDIGMGSITPPNYNTKKCQSEILVFGVLTAECEGKK